MTERALLFALDRHDLPLSPPRPGGRGWLVRTEGGWVKRGVIWFWTTEAVRNAVVRAGWVASDGRITVEGREAIRGNR